MHSSRKDVSSIPENPFFHRGPIRDHRYFFGRTRETRQALRMLRYGQCVSIVGPRRIGETSLMFHLCDPVVQQASHLGDEHILVYVDCQGMGDVCEPLFYEGLWDETKRALAEREEADDWDEHISGFGEFREAMMTIQRKGYKPAFLLDEFESIALNPNLDQGLFSDLRSLVPTTVVYATASQYSLFDLTYADSGVLSSPFFNVFSEIHLGFLRPDETRKMVCGLLEMTGAENLFTELDLDFVFHMGGHYPFFVQCACYHLFEQKLERKDLTPADYETIQQHYAEDVEAHFRYAWINLDTSEKEAVKLVCEGRISQLDDRVKRQLERKCILHNDAVFSSAFTEFIQRQMTETEAKALVFLSYAREDEGKVEHLYQQLSDAGFKPWMDRKDILPGEMWKSRIRKAIQETDFFLVCLTDNSVSKRGFIQKEIKDALDIWREKLDSDIYLIPVRLEQCSIPESLRDFQWVNLFEKDGWTQLVTAIQVGMDRRA